MRTDTHAATLRSAANDADADVDRLFDALTSPRRRFVLARLQDASKPMALADLADDIARWELDASAVDVSDDSREAIYVSLHHVHLPKLVEAVLVYYDRDDATVETTDTGEKLASLESLPLVE